MFTQLIFGSSTLTINHFFSERTAWGRNKFITTTQLLCTAVLILFLTITSLWRLSLLNLFYLAFPHNNNMKMWNIRWCAICEGNISTLVNVNVINRATIKQEHAQSITPTWIRPRVLLSNTHTHPFQEFHLLYSLHFWSIWDPLHNLLNNLISPMFPITKSGSIAFWFLSYAQQLRIQHVCLYQAWFTNETLVWRLHTLCIDTSSDILTTLVFPYALRSYLSLTH